MEDIKETTQKLTNNGFLQHVFNFDTDTKHYLMNTSQYTIMCLAPVILLNKLLEDLLSDFDNTKSNFELLGEVVAHFVALVSGIFFIHRLVTYMPTYSGIAYENINLFSIIIALCVTIYNSQSSLGLKMKLLGERVGELWNGKEEVQEKKQNNNNNNSPQLGQSAMLKPPQPTHQVSRSDYVLTQDHVSAPVQQQPNNQVAQNDSYGGNGQGASFGSGMIAEPMAANGVLGSAW
jgi:hypothetical protein